MRALLFGLCLMALLGTRMAEGFADASPFTHPSIGDD